MISDHHLHIQNSNWPLPSLISGLVAFNIVALLLSLVSVGTWLAQFFLRLRANALMREDRVNGGWSTEGRAGVGGSFWMVLAAAAIFFVNATVFLALHRKRTRRRAGSTQVIIESGKPNGNLMLY